MRTRASTERGKPRPSRSLFRIKKHVKTNTEDSPELFHCLWSFLAAIGAFTGWDLWFVCGGWERRHHWAEATLWAISSIVGLLTSLYAATAAGRARRRGTVLIALCMSCFHLLSCFLLLLFLFMLTSGGPR